MKIGEIIKNYRIANDLSQRTFAKKCGVSFGYISMLESGKSPRSGKPLVPALTVLNKLAIGMGITIDQLIEQADDMDISLAPTRMQIDFDKSKIPDLFAGIDFSRDNKNESIFTKRLPYSIELDPGYSNMTDSELSRRYRSIAEKLPEDKLEKIVELTTLAQSLSLDDLDMAISYLKFLGEK